MPVASFAEVYDAHFAFVWRSLRRLGVMTTMLDDAVQDVFLVVYKRLAEFEGRSSMKTWLFAILLRVARKYHRTAQRKGNEAEPTESNLGVITTTPYDAIEQAEAVRLLYGILDQFEEERREVFVLAELEQMSAPEISEALDVNVNTVYTRLRAARLDFKQALLRYQAQAKWRAS